MHIKLHFVKFHLFRYEYWPYWTRGGGCYSLKSLTVLRKYLLSTSPNRRALILREPNFSHSILSKKTHEAVRSWMMCGDSDGRISRQQWLVRYLITFPTINVSTWWEMLSNQYTIAWESRILIYRACSWLYLIELIILIYRIIDVIL